MNFYKFSINLLNWNYKDFFFLKNYYFIKKKIIVFFNKKYFRQNFLFFYRKWYLVYQKNILEFSRNFYWFKNYSNKYYIEYLFWKKKKNIKKKIINLNYYFKLKNVNWNFFNKKKRTKKEFSKYYNSFNNMNKDWLNVKKILYFFKKNEINWNNFLNVSKKYKKNISFLEYFFFENFKIFEIKIFFNFIKEYFYFFLGFNFGLKKNKNFFEKTFLWKKQANFTNKFIFLKKNKFINLKNNNYIKKTNYINFEDFYIKTKDFWLNFQKKKIFTLNAIKNKKISTITSEDWSKWIFNKTLSRNQANFALLSDLWKLSQIDEYINLKDIKVFDIMHFNKIYENLKKFNSWKQAKFLTLSTVYLPIRYFLLPKNFFFIYKSKIFEQKFYNSLIFPKLSSTFNWNIKKNINIFNYFESKEILDFFFYNKCKIKKNKKYFLFFEKNLTLTGQSLFIDKENLSLKNEIFLLKINIILKYRHFLMNSYKKKNNWEKNIKNYEFNYNNYYNENNIKINLEKNKNIKQSYLKELKINLFKEKLLKIYAKYFNKEKTLNNNFKSDNLINSDFINISELIKKNNHFIFFNFIQNISFYFRDIFFYNFLYSFGEFFLFDFFFYYCTLFYFCLMIILNYIFFEILINKGFKFILNIIIYVLKYIFYFLDGVYIQIQQYVNIFSITNNDTSFSLINIFDFIIIIILKILNFLFFFFYYFIFIFYFYFYNCVFLIKNIFIFLINFCFKSKLIFNFYLFLKIFLYKYVFSFFFLFCKFFYKFFWALFNHLYYYFSWFLTKSFELFCKQVYKNIIYLTQGGVEKMYYISNFFVNFKIEHQLYIIKVFLAENLEILIIYLNIYYFFLKACFCFIMLIIFKFLFFFYNFFSKFFFKYFYCYIDDFYIEVQTFLLSFNELYEIKDGDFFIYFELFYFSFWWCFYFFNIYIFFKICLNIFYKIYLKKKKIFFFYLFFFFFFKDFILYYIKKIILNIKNFFKNLKQFFLFYWFKYNLNLFYEKKNKLNKIYLKNKKYLLIKKKYYDLEFNNNITFLKKYNKFFFYYRIWIYNQLEKGLEDGDCRAPINLSFYEFLQNKKRFYISKKEKKYLKDFQVYAYTGYNRYIDEWREKEKADTLFIGFWLMKDSFIFSKNNLKFFKKKFKLFFFKNNKLLDNWKKEQKLKKNNFINFLKTINISELALEDLDFLFLLNFNSLFCNKQYIYENPFLYESFSFFDKNISKNTGTANNIFSEYEYYENDLLIKDVNEVNSLFYQKKDLIEIPSEEKDIFYFFADLIYLGELLEDGNPQSAIDEAFVPFYTYNTEYTCMYSDEIYLEKVKHQLDLFDEAFKNNNLNNDIVFDFWEIINQKPPVQ